MGGFLPLRPPLLSPLLPPSPPPKGWSIRHPASLCLRGNRWKLHILNKTAAPRLEPLSPVYAPGGGGVPSGGGNPSPGPQHRWVRAAGTDGAGISGRLAPLSDVSRGAGSLRAAPLSIPPTREESQFAASNEFFPRLSPKGEQGSV